MDDYDAVRRLVEKPLSEGLETAVPQNAREVVEAVRSLLPVKTGPRLAFDPEEGVSQRQVADALKRDRSVVSRNVAIATDQGFLVNLAPGQGRESRLIMGDRKLPSGSVLPSPEELGEPMKKKPEPIRNSEAFPESASATVT
jgi:hypothetical protein